MDNKIHDIVLDDCWLKIFEITKLVNISEEHVLNILYDLWIWEKCWRDGCCIYSQLSKIESSDIKSVFGHVQVQSKWNLRGYVTVDETGVHYDTLNMN